MNTEKISIGKAIIQMKALTKQGIPFSMSFMSYNTKKRSTHGRVTVPKAFIRKNQAPVPGSPNTTINYYDVSQQANKRCHECLLLTFNNKTIVL